MKITKATVYTCSQPLKIPFRHASSGLVDHLDGVYVKLDTAEGVSGFGEVRGNCSYFTGDTTGAVVATLASTIVPKLVGQDPLCLNGLHSLIQGAVVGNQAAKAACDAAVYDLAGKLQHQPVHQLLGGKVNSLLPSEENIPFMPVEEARALAQRIIQGGSRFIKVRVGAPHFREDLERVAAVWQEITNSGLQDDITFSVDANQAWGCRDAVRYISQLAALGVTIVEQPMKFASPQRLAELKRCCPVKLFGDESVATVEDFIRYAELGAIDGIHIKLIKCGGIANAVRLMHLAEAHEIEYMIGGMDEGMMAVAAAVQCAAVANTRLFEVHGHLRIREDPTSGLVAQGSVVTVPDAPGLGVTIDEKKLVKQYETA